MAFKANEVRLRVDEARQEITQYESRGDAASSVGQRLAHWGLAWRMGLDRPWTGWGRYGYEAEASQIQALYLSGDKRGAAALVPDEMLELTNLVGPEGYIRDRIAAFKESGVTVLQVTPVGPDTVALMEKVRTWVDA
jgi:hypothetical protein